MSDDVYRIAVTHGDSMREVDLMIANKIPAQHLEWRLANDLVGCF